ncbi:MAG: hypothetical protein ACOYJ2_01045 [Rickettsiales bacterium]
MIGDDSDKLVNFQQLKLFREIKSYVSRLSLTDTKTQVVASQLSAPEAEEFRNVIERYNSTILDSDRHLPMFSYELVAGADKATLTFTEPVNDETFGMGRAMEVANLEMLALEQEVEQLDEDDARNAELLGYILSAKFDGLVRENPTLTKLADAQINISFPLPNHNVYTGDAYQHRIKELNQRIEDLGIWIGRYNSVAPAAEKLPNPTFDPSSTMAKLTLSSLMEPEKEFENLYKLGCPRMDLILLPSLSIVSPDKSPPPPPR